MAIGSLVLFSLDRASQFIYSLPVFSLGHDRFIILVPINEQLMH